MYIGGLSRREQNIELKKHASNFSIVDQKFH